MDVPGKTWTSGLLPYQKWLQLAHASRLYRVEGLSLCTALPSQMPPARASSRHCKRESTGTEESASLSSCLCHQGGKGLLFQKE